MTQVPFDCDVCEGPVEMTTGPGRRYDYRTGFSIEIPADFATATCKSCGATYLNTAEAEYLDRYFKSVTEKT